MACNFDIQLTMSADELATKAKKLVEDAGGTFSGDSTRGDITVKLPVGTVQGNYTVSGQTVSFNISKKPMLVPCSAIQSFLQDRLK